RRWLDAGTGRSVAWAAVARNLASVVVDPGTDDADRRISTLLDGADVLLTDPGSPFAELRGDALDHLRHERPDLVIVDVSPFGRTGPRADAPSSDVAAEALAGLAHVTGHPDREPLHSD